ncbi:unnamed protein product [Sphenostylis stenocarpa]|uniref:CASP-like protein n=1 Tax=Sphenostylis stenocarpa TaxID=92480 RepID=A0AA86SBR3_9FABA|nr:unnamed protein product [Sphenostylis stenocarpa]
MVTEQRKAEEIQHESKFTALETTATISGSLAGDAAKTRRRRRVDAVQLVLRGLCMAASVASISFMVTAKESSSIEIYLIQFPLQSKWSFSDSFEYLVGVAAAVAAHSLLQLLIGTSRFLKMSSVIPSRNHAWLLFAGDQVFAYALMSAGSAASGVTNLNRTGVRHTPLPNFCKLVPKFCDHVAISIVFTFTSCLLMAASAVQDVIWLSQH